MSKINFLPLGPVVQLVDTSHKVVIIKRGVELNQDEKYSTYYDYGGVYYPEGVEGTETLYFRRATVKTVLFCGYSDKEETNFIAELNAAIAFKQSAEGSDNVRRKAPPIQQRLMLFFKKQ
jgi:hypothetical protein